jgi:hypothetical protein
VSHCRRTGPRPSRDRTLDPAHYIPLDETLAWAPVRALRALRWLGWADIADLTEATGIGPDLTDRNGLSSALCRHRKAGRVELREVRLASTHSHGRRRERQYRITEAGRAWLRAQLQTEEERAAWERAA